MKKKIIRLTVLEGSVELKGKKLKLIKVSDGVYRCLITKIKVVDVWHELDLIEEYSKISEDNIFFDLHLFSMSFQNELKFIDEVKYRGTSFELVGVANNKRHRLIRKANELIYDNKAPF